MSFENLKENLESTYPHEYRLEMAEELLPLVGVKTHNAIEILRYCRFQRLQSNMADTQISVLTIAPELINAGISESVSDSIEKALMHYIGDLEYIDFLFLEKLELKILGLDMLTQAKEGGIL